MLNTLPSLSCHVLLRKKDLEQAATGVQIKTRLNFGAMRVSIPGLSGCMHDMETEKCLMVQPISGWYVESR